MNHFSGRLKRTTLVIEYTPKKILKKILIEKKHKKHK